METQTFGSVPSVIAPLSEIAVEDEVSAEKEEVDVLAQPAPNKMMMINRMKIRGIEMIIVAKKIRDANQSTLIFIKTGPYTEMDGSMPLLSKK